jgi:hypothetical protein
MPGSISCGPARRRSAAGSNSRSGQAVSVEYYSQRLLNPFRGCIQVIRDEAAEAVSMDGVHWDIYVSNDALLEGLQQGW